MTTEDDFAEQSGVILSNELGRKQLAWLLKVRGHDAVIQAVAALAGRRRPYPTNLARAIGVRMPHFDAEDSAGGAGPASEPVAQVAALPVQSVKVDDVVAFAQRHLAEGAAAAERQDEYLRVEREAEAAATLAKLDALRARKGLPLRR